MRLGSHECAPYCAPLFESSHVLVAVLDPELRFLQVNQAYARFTGRTAESFVGVGHFELYSHAENEALFRRVVETGERYAIREKAFEHPDRGPGVFTYWDWSLDPARNADGTIVGVVLQLVDVTDHVKARRLAAEQEVLLRELHHRVKNNLQIVGGLLRDAKRRHPEVGTVLDSTLGRIATIAHIHDLVSGDADLGSIELGRYASAIAAGLEALHERPDIRIEVEGACPVPLDLASPLGMILHELVSNALEHAYPSGSGGTIRVLVRCEEDRSEIEVCDDGAGLPDRGLESGGSIGLDLVDGLCRQLGGTFEAHALTPRGTCCHLSVPVARTRVPET